MDRLYYIAQQADAVARRRYAQARSKSQIQGEDLAVLGALVTPLILKGQPLTRIYAEHGEELPVLFCYSTILTALNAVNSTERLPLS